MFKLSIAISGIVLFSSGWSDASAQQQSLEEVRKAAVRRGMDSAVSSFCPNAPITDQSAITVRVAELPAAALSIGEDVATAANPIQIGSLDYAGKGVSITSDDRRFRELIVDHALFALRLPNGDRLNTWNLVHSTGGGQCNLALEQPPSSAQPPRQRPDEFVVSSRLPGYKPGPAWPWGVNSFIGLMHPERSVNSTLIVSFSAGSQPRVEAELPFALQSIRVGPPPHGGQWHLSVIGQQPDGSIIQFVLRVDPPTY